MNQDKDMPIELTDTELAQIQGGGWLGDAWNAVKKGAKVVGGVVVAIIDAVLHPPKDPNDPFPKPRPWPPVYY